MTTRPNSRVNSDQYAETGKSDCAIAMASSNRCSASGMLMLIPIFNALVLQGRLDEQPR